MAKLILDDLVNLQNEQSAVGTINSNSTATEAALENTLSRDGTSPNQMLSDLDMNSNSILNLPAPTTNTEPLRLGDLPDILPTILVADDAPVTSYTENSLWIDSDSADYDLYQLQGNTWVDTGVNLEGVQGDQGVAATIEVGGVTTLPYTDDATVANVGTVTDAVFDFGIPQGVPGRSGIPYLMSEDTDTTTDQGNGYVWVNNSDPTLVTELAISKEDQHGGDRSAFLASLIASSTIELRKNGGSEFYLLHLNASPTDASTFVRFTVEYEGHLMHLDEDELIDVIVTKIGQDGPPWNQWQGSWQTSTAYVENDAVENDGSSYICTDAHTSGSTTEPGVGVDWATVWDLFASKGADGLGTGDVTAANAFGTDNRVIRSDGTSKGVQASGISIDDSDNVSGVNNVTGSDTNFVTGTAGTNGNLAQWNADGDIVDGPDATDPQFTSIELSHATQNTLTASGGTLSIEGVVNPSFTNTAWAAAAFSSPNITCDVANGTQLTFTRTMAGNETLAVPSNMPDGATIYVAIAAGANTLTFASGYEGAGDALPALEGDCLVTIVKHGSRYYVSALTNLGDGA